MLRYDLLSRFTFLLSYRFYVIDSDCIILVVINKELRNHSPQAFNQYLPGTQVNLSISYKSIILNNHIHLLLPTYEAKLTAIKHFNNPITLLTTCKTFNH